METHNDEGQGGFGFDQLPVAVAELMPDGRVCHWNPAAEHIFRYVRAELEGQLFWEVLVPEKQRAEVRKRFENVVVNPADGKVELDMLRKDGTACIVLWALSINERGHLVCCGMDITSRIHRARQELRRERRLLEAYIDNVPDHIYFKDEQSRFTLVNQATADHHEWARPSDAIGKTDHDTFSREHGASLCR